jgi:hypothetical protein
MAREFGKECSASKEYTACFKTLQRGERLDSYSSSRTRDKQTLETPGAVVAVTSKTVQEVN